MNRSRSFSLTILLWIFCLISPVFAEFEASVLVAKDTVSVEAREVKLKDIAQIVVSEKLDSTKVESLREYVVVELPEIGIQKKIYGQDLVRSLKQIVSNLGYYIPDELGVVRIGRNLERREVGEAVTKYLRNTTTGKEVKRVKGYTPSKIPADTEELVVSEINFEANIARVELTVLTSSEERHTVNAEVELEKFVKIPLVANGIVRGSKVTEEDLVMARVDLSRIPRGALTKPEQIINQIVTRNLRSGDYFSQQGLRGEYLVHKGKEVIAVVRQGSLHLELKGVALEDGSKDEIIKIRNPASNRIIYGKVVAPDRAIVGF